MIKTHRRGKHKIFIGMSPGVGKTYRMLYVLFVDNPDRFLTKAESLHIETCERLCKEFAGNFIWVRNSHALGAIVETSRSYRITQIVMGESQKSRWQILFKGSLTQRILRLLKNVDIHIISTSKIQQGESSFYSSHLKTAIHLDIFACSQSTSSVIA